LKGTLGGEGRLPSHRTRTPRDVKPASFSKDEAAAIVIKIIEKTAIDGFNNKEQVFLKRFLLQLLADNNSKKKVEGDPLKNCLKQRLDWTIAEFALKVKSDVWTSLDNNKNIDEICTALEETLQKIKSETAS